MATFDYSKAAGIISTSPNPILDTMQTQFGVPQCMMDFTKDVLAPLPGAILNFFKNDIESGKAEATSVYKNNQNAMRLDTGIVEQDTEAGKFIFVSNSSNKGVEEKEEESLDTLEFLGKALEFGADAWVLGEKISAKREYIKNCIDKVMSMKALQKGPSAVADKYVGFKLEDGSEFPPPEPPLKASSQVYDSNKAELEIVTSFIAKADTQLQNIREIQQARLMDPENNPEPCFWENATLSGIPLGDFASGAAVCLIKADANADGSPIIPPIDDLNPFVDIINVSGMLPPVSKQGQFLLSKTGIYYDAYGGGLDYSGCISNIVNAIYFDSSGDPRPGTGVPPNALKWLLKYNPNIGGKGEIVTWATFNRWANTAFDINRIDESPSMQKFYEDDHFLQVVMDQRNREIYDLSSYITQLQGEGYTEDSAVLSNQRQTLYSKIAAHDRKIKKRKKQIEVHVALSPADNPAVMGEIPINTFEGLDGSLLAIEKQKQDNLIFNPGEVSGVVLPLCPTFIKNEIPQDTFTVEDLMVPPIGVGSIITSDQPVSGTSGTLLSLTDNVTTKGLVAIYNFLDSTTVKPDSDKYLSINCATSAASTKAAQLVASSVESMFPSGVGLPYFRGVCNFFSGVDGDGNSKASTYASNNEYLYSPYRPYGYARLKSGFNDIDSLLYSETGASFDFWTHLPDLVEANGLGWNGDKSLSALHRVVMSCENRGGSLSSVNDNWTAGPERGSTSVRGLMMGFTRDCRITSGTAPSNDPADNDITKGLVFHMSPTQSIDTSGITFMSASADPIYCVDNVTPPNGFYGIAVDTSSTTTGGHKFNDCSSAFVHTAVTINYSDDIVSIYLNGELLTTSSVKATFGTEGPPRLPSMITSASFSYDIEYEDILPENAPLFPPNSLGQLDFWWWNGPRPEGSTEGVFFTPWTIGGGYTDGMHTTDLPTYSPGSNEGMNFMGGKWGGKKSGLYGFLGSLKLYNKAISAAEALKNYEAQRGFFTNIRTYPY